MSSLSADFIHSDEQVKEVNDGLFSFLGSSLTGKRHIILFKVGQKKEQLFFLTAALYLTSICNTGTFARFKKKKKKKKNQTQTVSSCHRLPG